MAEGGSGIFRGLGFKLVGFDEDPAKEEEYREVIQKEGGVIKKIYTWPNLYLIASSAKMSYSHELCIQARKNGAVVVNELWLEDSLSSGVPADVTKILYRPPLSLDCITGATDLKIALSGFSSEESAYLKKLVEKMGAENAILSRSSYLICNRAEGNDYEAATKRHIFTVNKDWLEACLNEWSIASIDKYVSRPRKYRTPVKDTYENREPHSTGKKRSTKEEACIGSPKGSQKRYASSTGCRKPCRPARESPELSPTSSRRYLDFNRKRLSGYHLKRLSDWKATDLVRTVEIPKSRLKKTVGADIIKGALLHSFTELVNIHCRGDCIRNSISAEMVLVSLNSEEAIFENAQLVRYDEVLASQNKKQFALMVKELYKEKRCSVPQDVDCWLSCIEDGVPDRVLTRHVNMLEGNDIFAAFVKMFYIIKRMISKDRTSYFIVVDHILLDIYKDWKKHSFTWSVLHATMTYVNPKLLELYNLRCKMQISGGAGQSISPPEPKPRADKVFGLLEVIRDCFFHLAMDYQDLILPILLVQHPRLLSDLQRTLFSLGHLK